MNQNELLVINLLLMLVFVSPSFATTLDIGSDSTNSNNWTFTDGGQFIPQSSVLYVDNGDQWVNGWGFFNNSSATGFWTASLSFNALNPDGTGTVNISNFGIDDRAEVLLNGNLIDAVGNNGPGTGVFQNSYNGAYISTNFNPDNSALTISGVSLNTGVNTIEVIINNTDQGIFGSTIPPTAGIDLTGFALNASVSYTPNAVPLPIASWLFGSALAGFIGFNRRKTKQCHGLARIA